MKEWVASALVDSQAREVAVYLLGNVPGLPPIAQSLHILGIAVVMGSIVMVDLKLLGLAVPNQNVSEMIRRLMPWTWWALSLNAVTGLLFVLARPNRYFYNPVAEWKFSMLVPRWRWRSSCTGSTGERRTTGNGRRAGASRHAFSQWCHWVLWTGIVLAGRWIAYSDYLFFYE